MYARAIRPSACFNRWFDNQQQKEIVITKGRLGAIHVRNKDHSNISVEDDRLVVEDEADGKVRVRDRSGEYELQTVGVVPDAEIVDTTGAGDAFIGGYILSKMLNMRTGVCLGLGSWVAARKLAGPGARRALPTGTDVDDSLGRSEHEIQSSLTRLLSPFGR